MSELESCEMRTKIFFASATSGTGSMIRILCRLGGYCERESKFVDRFMLDGRLAELRDSTVPQDGKFHVFNRPIDFNRQTTLSNYDFSLNFRDPRDRLCNMFHWTQSHPAPGVSEDVLNERRRRIAEQGIDSWVLKQAAAEIRYYDNFWWLINELRDRYKLLTYAQLCLDFDGFVDAAADFVGVDLSDELREQVEPERVENLAGNPKWVGNRWSGSDTMPGRYKKELKEETIARLNSTLSEVLSRMAKIDSNYSHLYLEGV
ncbi:hypothetical protein [Microbulbifer zhoushanensis]|uniref:hypothetical protein n=1 Tax=Microbulbifer zhoushanensis TaxID=2904254 RepID=UPI001F35045C|nr:hypothetical protein [Microbulbifer zhoushanensis]